MGGCSPKKNQKKPVATPKLANWHWFFLVFFGFFWFFKISKLALVFFGFFWFFLVFFGIGFGQNSKLETGFFWFFFWVFLVFLVFFGLSFGQHSKLETGFWVFLVFFGFFWFFLGFFGFFWHLILWLECHPKKNQKIPKKTKKKPKKPKKTQKKNQKKPVATPKLVNWLGFFWFFLG